MSSVDFRGNHQPLFSPYFHSTEERKNSKVDGRRNIDEPTSYQGDTPSRFKIAQPYMSRFARQGSCQLS